VNGRPPLRRNRPFWRLWSAHSISFVGGSISLVALMLHTAESTGAALAVALLLLIGDFAPSLLSPFTGAISDRFDLKRVMIAGDLIQAALVTTIALTLPPLPVLLALVAASSIVGQTFQAASRSAIPRLVRDRDLETANSVLGFGMNGSEALGPLLAALLYAMVGVRGALLVDAATFVASAALIAFVPTLPSATARIDARPSLLSEARAGLGYIRATPAVRIITVGFFTVVAFNGIDDVALVFLATVTFDAGESAVGLLLGAVGAGLLVGFALLTRFAPRLAMVPLLILGFGVSSAGNLLTGLAWAVEVAFAMQLVRGLGIAAIEVGVNTLIQRLVPAAMVGRVFGNLYGAIGAAGALSYVVGGLVLDLTSAPVTLVIAGAGGLAATIATALVLPRAVKQATERIDAAAVEPAGPRRPS
jgi:MFS family permease